MFDFKVSRNAFGQLVLTAPDGNVHENVVPVRAFPIAAPQEGIVLVSADSHELVWIAHLTDLPEDARALVEEALENREFVPEIRRLRHVSSFATPTTWEAETDRGDTRFVLKGEDDIRRLDPPAR